MKYMPNYYRNCFAFPVLFLRDNQLSNLIAFLFIPIVFCVQDSYTYINYYIVFTTLFIIPLSIVLVFT